MKKKRLLLLIIAVFILLSGSAAYSQEQKTYEGMDKAFSLLVVGCADNAEGTGQEVRAVILMTVNHAKDMVYFTNFRSDLLVRKEDGSFATLDDIWKEGGSKALKAVIADNFGLKVPHFGQISLMDVARIIGMEDFENLDVGRDGLLVLENLVHSLNVGPGQLLGYVTKLLPYVSHDFGFFALLDTLGQVPAIVNYVTEEISIPEEGEYTQEEQGLSADIDACRSRMLETIFG